MADSAAVRGPDDREPEDGASGAEETVALEPETDLRILWDREAEAWTLWTRTPGLDLFFSRYNLPAFLELVPAPSGLTVEVGCGEGRVARALLAHGHRVVGVDGSWLLARRAHEGLPSGGAVPATAADAAAVPLTDRCADLVVSFMCLQDVDDLDGAVQEVDRLLRPGGVCCIAVLHPFDTAGRFESDDPRAGFGLERPYPTPARYAEELRHPGGRMVFRGWHRPIAAYLNALSRAGLVLDEVREPVPSAELALEHPRLARQQRVPAWLHLRAVKPPRQERP